MTPTRSPAQRVVRVGAWILGFVGLLIGLGVLLLWVVLRGWLGPSGSASDGRAFFEQHETELERVAEMVADGRLVRPDGQGSYLGPKLPKSLSHLSVTGHVMIEEGDDFFLPQWTGIPDDAGGIWHAAAAPEGEDMYGLGCQDPLHLKDDWWLCAMAP